VNFSVNVRNDLGGTASGAMLTGMVE